MFDKKGILVILPPIRLISVPMTGRKRRGCIIVKNVLVEWVCCFKYLKNILTDNMDFNTKIPTRTNLMKMSALMRTDNLNLRQRIIIRYIHFEPNQNQTALPTNEKVLWRAKSEIILIATIKDHKVSTWRKIPSTASRGVGKSTNYLG